MKKISYALFPVVAVVVIMAACQNRSTKDNKNPQSTQKTNGITRNTDHPFFWSYKGEPILLLGGSDEDNLFQSSDLEEQLDMLVESGGNYVRNTMSSRDAGNLWPFHKNEDDLYDLSKWNDEYWERFSDFLQATAERDIIVQIEIWATFDFYRNEWNMNPYNPKNNINYDTRRSKLSEVVETHPIYAENNFFRSVPSQMALMRVMDFQQAFVDQILSYSLNYDHVLYCMDNETSVTSDWGKFWAQYIQKKASLQDKMVYTTEMWDPWNLQHAFHLETFDNPDIFTFADISQNNHQSGEHHWNNAQQVMERLKKMGNQRPLNNVKIYGNDGSRHKTTRDATENFVKNILVGSASARFHRPTSGQGINKHARSVIRSMRMLTMETDHFNGQPANELLVERSENEAFCRAIPNKEYVVFFPAKGSVKIELTDFEGQPQLRWLNLLSSEWSEIINLEKNMKEISTPDDDYWIALIQ